MYVPHSCLSSRACRASALSLSPSLTQSSSACLLIPRSHLQPSPCSSLLSHLRLHHSSAHVGSQTAQTERTALLHYQAIRPLAAQLLLLPRWEKRERRGWREKPSLQPVHLSIFPTPLGSGSLVSSWRQLEAHGNVNFLSRNTAEVQVGSQLLCIWMAHVHREGFLVENMNVILCLVCDTREKTTLWLLFWICFPTRSTWSHTGAPLGPDGACHHVASHYVVLTRAELRIRDTLCFAPTWGDPKHLGYLTPTYYDTCHTLRDSTRKWGDSWFVLFHLIYFHLLSHHNYRVALTTTIYLQYIQQQFQYEKWATVCVVTYYDTS